jgi:hypothetical protein
LSDSTNCADLSFLDSQLSIDVLGFPGNRL